MKKVVFLFVLAMVVFITPAYAREPGFISVTGEAHVMVEPDMAHVFLGVETQGADAASAQAANNNTMGDVIESLMAFGISETDVQTMHFHMHPIHDWTDMDMRVIGYMVSNSVRVTVRDLDTLGDLLAAATDAGANATSHMSFAVYDGSEAYNQALTQAIADAQSRAELIAAALGTNLGPISHVSESGGRGWGFADPRMGFFDGGFGMSIAASAGVPIQRGEMAISAWVHITFSIEP